MDRCRQTGELRAWIDVQLGNLAFDRGYYGQTRMHYERALPVYEQIGNRPSAANCWRGLALVAAHFLETLAEVSFFIQRKFTRIRIDVFERHLDSGFFFRGSVGGLAKTFFNNHSVWCRLDRTGVLSV